MLPRDEFIAEYQSGYPSWAKYADARDLQEPGEDRVTHGWARGERLEHSFLNWHMHRTDRRLDALEARVAYLEGES